MAKKRTIAPERNYEILGVIMLGLTALLFLVLVTDGFQYEGTTRRPIDNMEQTGNLLGPPGAILAGLLAFLIGDAAHILYGITFIWGLMLFSHQALDRLLSRLVGATLLILAIAGFLQLNLTAGSSNAYAGGVMGLFISEKLLVPNFGVVGSNVVVIGITMIGILLTTDFLFIHALLAAQRFSIYLIHGILVMVEGLKIFWGKHVEHSQRLKTRRATSRLERAEHNVEPEPVLDEANAAPLPEGHDLSRIRVHQSPVELELPFEEVPDITEESVVAEAETAPEPAPVAQADEAEEIEAEITPVAIPDETGQLELAAAIPVEPPKKKQRRVVRKTQAQDQLPADYKYPKRYTKPSIELFDVPEPNLIPNLDAKLREMGHLLEETLRTFNIDARVTDITRGPTITRFELAPAPGVKVSRFNAVADDIALKLKAHRVRVEAPIPGKSRVGIEVPNTERDSVLVRELLENRAFHQGKGTLNLSLGKDIAGDVKIADLATMPHLLVAGATGAGKTVCVKALLASLLYAHTPDELQLILIDPKMVELSIFDDIPHLITPVVIDPKKASTALTWLIHEMEERYRLFAELRVRNIEVYNQSVENGEITMEGGEEEDHAEEETLSVIRKLPYIVCIIDELADLMMLARTEVEDAIGRLAQLARAVGIHLIIATQRPSVDVLTGVIKANFPARISFQVSSRVDSRCILDEMGAEKLIGMGDLLYLPAGQSKPTRIQGAFVSDEEMNGLIAFLKTQAPPQYRDEIENYGKTKEAALNEVEEDDPLIDEAVQVVLTTGQASISMVQRKLRVGYTRAARLIDIMERKGIVGPHTGSKARDILVNTASKDEVA